MVIHSLLAIVCSPRRMTFSTVQHVPLSCRNRMRFYSPVSSGTARCGQTALTLDARPSGVTVLTDCTLISVDNFKLDGPPDIVFS